MITQARPAGRLHNAGQPESTLACSRASYLGGSVASLLWLWLQRGIVAAAGWGASHSAGTLLLFALTINSG